MDWITDNKVPLGSWIKTGVDSMMDRGAWMFDAFSDRVVEGQRVAYALLWLILLWSALSGIPSFRRDFKRLSSIWFLVSFAYLLPVLTQPTTHCVRALVTRHLF